MGQTLTHGIYLPDEGERNCYNGLAANWQLLDGAVGTVAEHTSQIAGKAPLVHTHTKSDITDFPVYGTTAGTICEGNDSRLSDARTPVAHTHVTADVTDLLNSAHTWSGDNTYSKPVVIKRNTDTGNFLALRNSVAELGSTPASATPVTIAYRDKNDENLGYMGIYYDTDGSNHFRLYIRNKFTSGAPSTTGSYDYAFFGLRLNADKSKEGIIKASFRPYDNNTHDLGSSSYQWNNLYAKNYYYNGVAWGLDKYNQWTGVNDFNNLIGLNGAELWFKNKYIDDFTTNPAEYGGQSVLQIWNKNTTQYSGGLIDYQMTDGSHILEIVCFGYPLNDATPYQHRFRFAAYRDGVADFYPSLTNSVNLGTYLNKWKSFNGLNPGALSLPDGADSGANSSFTPDTTDWPKDGTAFQATMPIVGWLRITIKNVAGNYAFVRRGTAGANLPWQIFADPSFATDFAEVTLNVPVTNATYTLRINSSGGFTAKVYPCIGNV